MAKETKINGCSELPDELVIEILSRLPVKFLIKFTCVCKFWLSLIKSHEFATKQFATRKKLLQQNHKDGKFIIAYSRCLDTAPKLYVLPRETLEVSAVFQCKPFNHDHCDEEHISCSLYGPCNGIFSLLVRKKRSALLLWNPATRELFKPLRPRFIFGHLGFGFDYKNNDYKMIMFPGHGGESVMQIYSLLTNSWRHKDISLTKNFIYSGHNPTQFGKMLTWLGYYSQPKFRTSLLSFDMVGEVFVETPMPEAVPEFSFCVMQQCSSYDHPALLCYSWSRIAFVECWVLSEYGAAGRWTKQHSLKLPDITTLRSPINGFGNHDVVFFIFQERLLQDYNPIRHEVKSLVPEGDHVLVYNESLFSIRSACQQSGQREDDKDNENQAIEGRPYCLCEVNQQACSNCTFVF